MSSVSSHEGPRSALPSPTDSMEARNGLETARNPSFSNNGEGPGWSSGSLGNGRGPLMGSSLGHRRKMDFSNMLGVSPPLMGASVETALPDHMGRSAPNYGGSHPDPLLGESSSTRLEDDANATGSPIEMPSDDDDFADNQPHAAPSYFAATPPATGTGAQSRAVVDSTASPTTAQSLSLSSATALPPAGFDSRNPSSAMQQTMRPSQHPAPLGPPASNHSSPSLPSVTRHDAPNERGVNEWSAGNSTLSSLTSTPVQMNPMQHQHHRHHQQYGPTVQQQNQQFGFPVPTSTPPLAQSGKLMRRAVSLGDISSLPYQQHHQQAKQLSPLFNAPRGSPLVGSLTSAQTNSSSGGRFPGALLANPLHSGHQHSTSTGAASNRNTVVASASTGHRWTVSTSVSPKSHSKHPKHASPISPNSHNLQPQQWGQGQPYQQQQQPTFPQPQQPPRGLVPRVNGGARSADDITAAWGPQTGWGTASSAGNHRNRTATSTSNGWLSPMDVAGFPHTATSVHNSSSTPGHGAHSIGYRMPAGGGIESGGYHDAGGGGGAPSVSLSGRSKAISARSAASPSKSSLTGPNATVGATVDHPPSQSSNTQHKSRIIGGQFVADLVSNLLRDEVDDVDALEKGRVKRKQPRRRSGDIGDNKKEGDRRPTGRIVNVAEGMHSIPWDDRAVAHGSGVGDTNECDCCKSRRFLWRVDWAMRCTFLSVLPCAIYGLVVSHQLDSNSTAKGRQFILPGLAVVMSFWCSRHMLGDSLRELFSVLKGIVPAFCIALICVGMAPPNRWLWLLFYAITLLILASITDTTRRPACFLTASTLAVYLLFIEGRLDLYRGQAISYISLSGFSNATTTVTSDVNYEFMSELLADVLIGLAFGCVSIVLPWPNWSLKRAREYVTLLSSVASMTTMGVTHSLWTTTVVDREAYLVRLRYFRQTYMEAMRVIDQSLLDSEYEPFYDRELQNVRDKRDLLETLMNILHSTSHIIEVLSMERKELQTVGSNDPAMHSGEQRRNPAFPGAMFTPEGLTPLAQQNAMSSDPTFEAFRVSLKDDLLAFASVLDRFILQITNLRSLDEMDPVEHKRELQLGLHLMQRSKGRFYDAVDRTRQTAIFNNDAYVPGKGDIIVGAFLFCIEEISEVLIAFTRHEIRKTREFASTTKLGFFEVGAGTLKQKKHRVKSDDDGNTAGGDNDGWCYAMFGAENGPLYFPRRMAKALLYDFLSVFIAIRLNAQAMLFAPRRLPRRVKEALKMVVSMVLSALCELYIIGYLDPISGGALIPWMCEFQQSTVVYRPKGASTKHDDDDKVAMRKTRAQGLAMDASSKLGEKKNAYEQKFKDNRTYSTTIYHGVYHVMLFRVLGTTSGSVIAYILAEYGISLGMGYAGFLVSLFVCVFAGSFIQTSRNYSSAGAGFIWGSVTISTGFNSFREVAINRFTSNVIAVIIYFIIAFLVWPENAQVNIRVAFDENLRAFRDATVTILLSVKSRKSAERTIREEIEVGHGDGGSDDDTLFLADDYLDSTSETDAASVSGTSSTSMSADQDTSSMSTDERRALRRRRHTKRPPTREPVEVSASSGSELNHDNDSFKRSSAMGSFMGRIFGTTLRPGGGAGQSFAGPRSRATYESDMPPSQQVPEEGNIDTQTLTPTAGDLTDTELRLTHFFRRQQLIRSSISALSRTVQREEGLLPAATREPTLEALAFPAEQWRNLLASQRNLLHLLGLLRFTFVTFSMSTTDAEIAESNRKARKQEALRAANGNGSEGGASSMFGGTLKDQSSRQFREAIASGKKRPKGMEVDPSVGGTLFQASQDTSAVVSQSIHWDILKALQRSATKIAIELPSLIDLYLVSIRGESNVPTSQLVSKRLSIQAIQLEMEAAYFDTIIRYARRNMLDDVQQALEEDAEENEAAAAKAQEMEQERMSALLPSGSFTNQPGSPVVSPTPAGEQGGPSAGASADLPGSSQTLEPAAFLPPTVASTKPSTLPPAPVKKSMVAKWGSPAIAAEAATAPPSPSANQISPSHLTSAGAAASSASVTNDSFINGPPISSETEDDKDSMSRRYSFSKPPLGRMPAFGVSPNMVTTEDGNSVLNLGATDMQSVGGDSHDTRSASKSGVGGTSAGTVARTMTEKANDIPELAAALEFGMRGVSDANVNTTKGLLVENARAAMGKRNMNKKRFAEVELANLSFRIPSAGGLLELLKEVKAEAAAEDGKKAATAADKTGKTDLGDNDGDTISRVNDAVRQSGVNNNNNTGNATEFKGDESPTPNQLGDRGGNIPTAATVSFEVPSKDAVASPIPGRSPAGNASPSSNHRKLQVLGKVIKNLVLASVDVHSIEAFLFGLRAVVAEISRLEAAILELRHADETARLLAN